MAIKLEQDFVSYYKKNGPHFTKELCEYVVGMMETKRGKIIPFTKDTVD